MAYPVVGNYGMNRHDIEARRPFVHGLVLREQAKGPSNWRHEQTLDRLLKEYGIPGNAGVDTRMLTRKIRAHGTMKGGLTTKGLPGRLSLRGCHPRG